MRAMRNTETGAPSSRAGLQRSPRKALIAASLSSAGPRTAVTLVTAPDSETTYLTMTVSSMPAAFAEDGYDGAARGHSGCVTFSVTRIGPVGFCGGGGFGGGATGSTTA